MEAALQAARDDTGRELSEYIAYTAYPGSGGAGTSAQGDQWVDQTPSSGTELILYYNDFPVLGAMGGDFSSFDCSIPIDTSGQDYYVDPSAIIKRRTAGSPHPDESSYNSCPIDGTAVYGYPSVLITVTKAPSCSVTPGEPIPDLPGYYLDSRGNIIPGGDVEYDDTPGAYIALAESGGVITEPILDIDDDRNTQSFWEAEAAAAGVSGDYGTDYPVPVTGVCVYGANSANVIITEGVLLSTIVADLC